jgi:diguanylate cyclase (GGDEF)-like protein
MASLLPGILKALARFDIFNIEQKGGIFLIEEKKMTLAAHLGHDKEFLESHEGIKLGVCLCGLVAQSGEMIISSDCFNDARHTIRSSNMVDHGNVIVPLKSSEGMEGVLYLYTKKGAIISERTQNLFQTIGNQVGTMIRESKLYEEIKSLSLYDPLTGLANRRMMNIHLKELLLNVKRSNKIFFILMLDIDYFKRYNDTFGHEAGDVLLTKIGAIFKKSVRESDLVARYGGEEFLMALSEVQGDSVGTIAERIRKTVEEETDVTISLGISNYRKGIEIRDLIKEADSALYKAKGQGRNRVVFQNP